MKRKLIITVCSLCLVGGISGCSSYRELEDSVREYIEGDAPDEFVEVDTEYENKSDVTDDNVAGIGDTIAFSDAEGGTMQYTLESVKFLDCLDGTGLKREDFCDPSKINENGNLVEADEKTLVLISVMVKNVNINIEDIEEENPFIIEPLAGSESNIKHPDGPFLEELDYFSGHADSIQDYYKFTLQEGEEMEVVLAWIVPNEMLEEPFYYMIGSSSGTEFSKFFQLNEGD